MINGLYIITHVSRKCKDTAFIGIKTSEITTTTDDSDNKATKEKELERYLKYY
jgi:hypothetical protein